MGITYKRLRYYKCLQFPEEHQEHPRPGFPVKIS